MNAVLALGVVWIGTFVVAVIMVLLIWLMAGEGFLDSLLDGLKVGMVAATIIVVLIVTVDLVGNALQGLGYLN